jgi:beta-glucanase (GH16 family)
MIFVNDPEDGFLSAAVQTRDEFLYGRWEARLKPSSVPGVLNSMYTIDWNNTVDNSSTSDGTKEEIDIEFLTFAFGNDTGSVHFAVHAEDKESFQTNPDVPLSFNPSEDFHVWGFEITPEKIEWFVDSTILQTYIYSQNDISITSPYQLKFNVWSAEKWINGPPEANVEAVYLIDWIRFTPYTSPVIYDSRTAQSAVPSVTVTRTTGNLQIRCVHTTHNLLPRCFLYTLKGRQILPVCKHQTVEETVFTFSADAALSSGCYCYQIQSVGYLISAGIFINQ